MAQTLEAIRIEKDSVAALEYEMAVLVRMLTATRPRNPQVSTMDRSAYLILHQLEEAGAPVALQDLASRLHADLSTVSRQVSAMEKKGLIQKYPDPEDSRVHRVAVTAHGGKQFGAMREARHATYSEILKDWPAPEREALATQLTRLNQAIRRYQSADRPAD